MATAKKSRAKAAAKRRKTTVAKKTVPAKKRAPAKKVAPAAKAPTLKARRLPETLRLTGFTPS
ncbi:MAG TPA: hypothetical protein PLD86_15990, partial [Vicinamibacteria bacterium]|nr:hypothetical protein [Vicinamibacteria bacterium]